MIILDFVREGGLSRYWYVLQNVAQDLSSWVDHYVFIRLLGGRLYYGC